MTLRGQRILITGGLGFIGSNLARRLVSDGAERDALRRPHRRLRRQSRQRPRDPLAGRDRFLGRARRRGDGAARRWAGHRLSPRRAGLPRDVALEPVSRHRHQHQGHRGRARGLPQEEPGRRRGPLGNARPVRAGGEAPRLGGDPLGSPRHLRDLAAFRRDDLPHVHPHPRDPDGSPAADEHLRAAGADEALAVRRRELVRAPRPRRPADPDLRFGPDPARLSLRGRLRRGPPRRGRVAARRRRDPERRPRPSLDVSRGRRVARRDPFPARESSSPTSRPSARRRSRATSSPTSRRSGACSAGSRRSALREGLGRTVDFYRERRADYF